MRVQGLVVRVWGSGFRVQGLGSSVEALGGGGLGFIVFGERGFLHGCHP